MATTSTYTSTFEWLLDNLSFASDLHFVTHRQRVWKSCAGMRNCGQHLVIYTDGTQFCAHSFSSDVGWKENENPMFGYFSKEHSIKQVIQELAERYDVIKLERVFSENHFA